jgi:hypothetical protein
MLLLATAMPAYGARRRKKVSIPIKAVGLLDFGGHLYLKGLLDGDKREQNGVVTNEEQTLFEQGVELNTRGYVYHPNLVDWSASIRAGLSQEWVLINDAKRKTNGTLLGYNFASSFFKQKPLSLHVFANQNQSLRDQSFAASTRAESQRQGATIRLRGLFPASLLVETGTNTEDSERRTLDSEVTHIRFRIADKRNRDWLTEFEFDHEDVTEISTFFNPGDLTGDAVDQSEVINEATLSNLWRFGPGPEKHSLSGSASIIDSKGFSPNRRLLANQRLDLIHSKTLSSFLRGSFDSDEGDRQSERIIDGEVGVRKKFYKSLDVTVRATGRDRVIDDDTEKTIGGFIDANYRKKTPLGLYTSTLLIGREHEERTSGGGARFNQDQSVVLTGLGWTFLSSNNVIDASIVVTNTDNTFIYVLDVDYEIRKTGQITEIRRRAGTTVIADPQTVHVDYLTEGTGDYTYKTDHLRWRHRLVLKKIPITLYTNYSLRDDTLIEGTTPGNFDNARTFLVGAELNNKGLRLAVEREQRDSLISPPSLTHRIRGSYTKPLGRNAKLSLSAKAEKLVYSQAAKFGLEEGADELETFGANAFYTRKLGANTLLHLKSIFLKTQGRDNNMEFTNGFSLLWQYGKLDLSIDGTYDIYEQEKIKGTAYNLMFYLKRKF